MPVVKTPNPRFNGERAGVMFLNGEATCTPLQASLMAQLGYQVLGDQKPVKTPQKTNVLPSRGNQEATTRKPRRKTGGNTP
jgi:hypothetical protein